MIKELELKIHRVRSTVQSAGGTQHRILGRVYTKISYNFQTQLLALYLCPSFKQLLYFAVDFWRKFGLAPEISGIEELGYVVLEFTTKGEPIVAHELNEEQHLLQEAREGF